jgi:hypothetical protein
VLKFSNPQVVEESLDHLLLLGLYPPAESKKDAMHENITSKALAKYLGYLFSWIDVCTQMPLGPCKNVKSRRLKTLLMNNMRFMDSALE